MARSMISPPYLKPGDKIAITATAKKVCPEEIAPAVKLFKEWGLEVFIPPNLYQSNGYLAGSDTHRRNSLQDCIDAPEIRAIFCARGGYGTTRIIDDIDFSAFIKSPKWLVGFSDVTALLLKVYHLGYESIHGAMPALFCSNDPLSIISLKDLLFGKPFSEPIPYHGSNLPGTARGRLIGGNLSLLTDSLGTGSALNGSGCILFIEEIDEYLYKIDRMLVQLKRSGKLQGLKGLLIGDMTGIKDTTTPFGQSYSEIILQQVQSYDYPVGFGLPTGHGYLNKALPIGREVQLTINEDQQGSLSSSQKET